MIEKLMKKRNVTFVVSIFILLVLFSSHSTIADDDEDNGNGFITGDSAKDIGYVAIGLFVAGMANVVVHYIFKFSQKLNNEGKSGKVKFFIRDFYLKSRKPLNWLHYIFTSSATTIIIVHGIRFINKEEEIGIFGWIATGFFLLYILTGIIIKLKIKPFWKNKIFRNTVNFLHKNLLIIIVVISLHIVHFLISE